METKLDKPHRVAQTSGSCGIINSANDSELNVT